MLENAVVAIEGKRYTLDSVKNTVRKASFSDPLVSREIVMFQIMCVKVYGKR